MKKKVLAILLSLTLCMTMLIGTGSALADEAPTKTYKVGLIVYNLTDAVPVRIVNQMKAYADMFGIELVVVGANGDKVKGEIENFITMGVDGILSASVEGIDGWWNELEEAGIPIVLGSTKIMTDSAKELTAGSKILLGQVSFDDVEVMNTICAKAIEDGTTKVGLIAPTAVTPNYLGVRKQAALDFFVANNIEVLEGNGESYFDFPGFTTSLLATQPDLVTYVSVTTPDSAYAAITQSEMNGAVKLYGVNRADTAIAAFEDGTLQSYCAGNEHCAAQFMILYNYLIGNDLRVDEQMIDLTTCPLYINSLEEQQILEECYGDKILYDYDFLSQVDTLAELEKMAGKTSLQDFADGSYLEGILD